MRAARAAPTRCLRRPRAARVPRARACRRAAAAAAVRFAARRRRRRASFWAGAATAGASAARGRRAAATAATRRAGGRLPTAFPFSQSKQGQARSEARPVLLVNKSQWSLVKAESSAAPGSVSTITRRRRCFGESPRLISPVRQTAARAREPSRHFTGNLFCRQASGPGGLRRTARRHRED